MKTNPVEAWKRVKPIIQNLLQAAGELLPDDLQSRVDAGDLSREAAFEINRTKAGLTSLERQQQYGEQQRRSQQYADQQAAVNNAANAWEADRKTRDPNYDKKSPLLMKEVVWLQQTEGKPTTPEGVRDQLQRAYDKLVVPVATATAPSKKAITPVMGGQANSNVKPATANTMDIIDNVLNQRQVG